MKNRIKKKLQKCPNRYSLHQYLKYAHQWVSTLSYKCKLYMILKNGKIVTVD